MKPIIGVFPSIKEDGTFWLYESYTNAMIDSGATPLVIPPITEENKDTLYALMGKCDGYLFTGGGDIEPSFYNAPRDPKCGASIIKRDEFELLAFSYAISTEKPILGICRGCQLMNVALGGTLTQDIPSAFPNAIRHTSESVANPTIHEIDIPQGSPLLKLSGAPRVKINSFHHQCTDKLGKGLKPLATSTADGIPEGIYFDGNRYLIGVQWHPERWYKENEVDKNLLKSFVEASKSR